MWRIDGGDDDDVERTIDSAQQGGFPPSANGQGTALRRVMIHSSAFSSSAASAVASSSSAAPVSVASSASASVSACSFFSSVAGFLLAAGFLAAAGFLVASAEVPFLTGASRACSSAAYCASSFFRCSCLSAASRS
jgi:hypothetical protein